MERDNPGIKSIRHLIILGVASGLILAALMYTSHVILHETIKAGEMGAALVNISGRQRMLSQRIAMLSLELVNSRDMAKKGAARKKLLEAVDLMEKSHNNLTDKDSGLNKHYGLSPQLRKIYFSSPHYLNSKVWAFTSEAKILAKAPDEELAADNPHILNLLNKTNEDLLMALDEVTNHYQKEQEKNIYRHEDMEDWSVGVSLFILAAMALFIFLPAIRHIKRETHALQESESRYNSIIETSVDGIITIDKNGVVKTLNPAAEKMFGYSSSEAINQNIKILMPEPFSSKHDTYIENYLKTGERKIIGIGREAVGKKKDGTIFQIELAVSEIMVGNERFFAGIAHDITERKAAEDNVTKTLSELERFNRLAVGREKRMIELKSEINALLHTMGKEEKYRVHKHEKQDDER